MTEPEPPAALATDPLPEGTVDAGIYGTHAEGLEHSLVVLAMGEDCWLVPDENGHHLRVEPAALYAIQRQLACFDRDNAGWPPPRPELEAAPAGRQRLPLSPLFWVLAALAVFWAQQTSPVLTEAWLLDAGRVFEHGEWWRIGSALWLHGDLGHLVSNAGSGLLVFSAVVLTFGLAGGWLRVLAASLAGNFAAVALHHGDNGYRSLGASTAIFAGLGLLTGRAVRVAGRAGPRRRSRPMLVPFAAGLAVLGLFGAGAGDANIDVLAHATGFGAGLVAGFIADGSPAPAPLKNPVSG